MSGFTFFIIPGLICAGAVGAAARGVDVLPAFTKGARRGLDTVLGILPSLIAMLTAIHMLQASGLLPALTHALSPVLSFMGMPPEMAPLALIRPISGSGALAVLTDIISRYGPDSLVGRTASVAMGSTETTFYTASVYFGSLGIKDTRWAIPAALCADLAGFLGASFFTRLTMG